MRSEEYGGMNGSPARRLFLTTLALISILVLYPIAPATGAVGYMPGVKPGDSATYGQVSAAWKSNVQPYSPVKDFLNLTTLTVSILNVVGSSVTARQTFSYANGTTRSLVLVENVETGSGNMSTGILWIIAGSLASPEPIYASGSAETIEQTVQMFYAGTVRTVNIINSTQPEPGGYCRFLRVWDQNSGVLIGFILNYTVSNTNYHVSASASAWMSTTSVWDAIARTPNSAGTPFLGLAILSAIIGITSAGAVHRRRRTPET